MLLNKANIWSSKDDFDITNGTNNFVYIQKNSNENMTLEIKDNGEVKEEKFVEDKPGQSWKKGESNKEGYFTLKHSESPKVMTAVSENEIKLKGKFVVMEK